jgi:putative ABC transport system substrate-binding protein
MWLCWAVEETFMTSAGTSPRRRALAVLALGALLAASGTSRAAPVPKRVAILGANPDDLPWKASFLREFEVQGFVEGRTLELLWFPISFEGPNRRLTSDELAAIARKRAAEAVAANPDCIVVENEPGTRFLQEATRAIPIVTAVYDPVAHGFARSLARPGGNITGLHLGAAEVALKSAETLKRLMPDLSCIVWIGWKALRSYATYDEAAARALGMRFRQVAVDGFAPADTARLREEVAEIRRDGCRAARIVATGRERHEHLARIAVEQGFVLVGGPIEDDRFLLDYRAALGANFEPMRRIPAIVARILRGERPADIPFEGPTKYEFFLNLRAAARLGIVVPPDVLVRADKVIGP